MYLESWFCHLIFSFLFFQEETAEKSIEDLAKIFSHEFGTQKDLILRVFGHWYSSFFFFFFFFSFFLLKIFLSFFFFLQRRGDSWQNQVLQHGGGPPEHYSPGNC